MMTQEQIEKEIKRCGKYMEEYRVRMEEDIAEIKKAYSLDLIESYLKDARKAEQKIRDYMREMDVLLEVLNA